MKAIKKKIKIKSEFLFYHVPAETIKRTINDLDIKRPSSGEIPTYFLKKCVLFSRLSQNVYQKALLMKH